MNFVQVICGVGIVLLTITFTSIMCLVNGKGLLGLIPCVLLFIFLVTIMGEVNNRLST